MDGWSLLHAVTEIQTRNSYNIKPALMPGPGRFWWEKVVVVPQSVPQSFSLLTSAVLLRKMLFPPFLAVSVTWLYTEWQVTSIPRHKL